MNADPAAMAFDQLRSEVALLRRAIEGLSARQAEPAPDYAPTLARLQRAVGEVREHVGQLAESPALSATPEVIASLVLRHASAARAEAGLELSPTLRALTQVTNSLTKSAGVIQVREAQRRRVGYAAVAGGVAALVAWVSLSGPISRALPASWQVPERAAAVALGRDRWAAGAQLMRGADEAAWGRLRRGEDLVLRNADVIRGCEARSKRLKQAVACKIHVGG